MPVQTWEYAVVIGYSNGRVFLNGQEQPPGKRAYEVLNELGAQSWELVGQSEVVGPAGGDITYTLRRPRIAEKAQ